MFDDLRSAYNQVYVPFSGAEYLRSLDDSREIWIYGERVRNVAEHPAFRNMARMVARLYQALHDPAHHAVLCVPTEWGGYTHRFFRAPLDVAEQVAQRNAIACWQQRAWGWMGRSPDYKGAFLATLGANADFYKGYEVNARRWYRKAQERTWFMGHAVVNPPVDRDLPPSCTSEVYVRVVGEDDAGIYVSGAKVVATGAALTHYIYVAHVDTMPARGPKFIVATNTPGVKLLCRVSNEYRAAVLGSPFDYPLSSRLDENDAILVMDNVFVPWENVFMHGEVAQEDCTQCGSGYLERASLHGCTRVAVKLDFIVGLLARALEITGTRGFHGVQVQLGEVIAWRNAFWGLSDAMAKSDVPWQGHVRPDSHFAGAYRVLSQEALPRIRNIIEQVVASGLIYINSHAYDFQVPEIRACLDKYLRGSGGAPAQERVKVMKMLWDAIGTEFGARHELYEINYIGSNDASRLTNLSAAQDSGNLERMKAFARSAMDEYDLSGWTVPDLVNPNDVSILPPGPLAK
ncbi:pyoverdin chromophore biosynthetic protein pvcC [Cupriavidus sp. TA19]|uniref:4-hydroxyphenylacetate 3-hydroxylase N-terminal domain-containing protein n=1 Tax=unclassified Cupriavidus TaxID=2640874 RepID=UPI000E2E6618|nr:MULTISPECIES: 4-hydroxyphenylacetate 3-hydroxylase N-terminal domain-containing protein [unclassified Cupriavidus]BDB28982.1 Pyoverdin chromophore biosynthetic protein pvcC [Cupriavidus sp. P-10]GLC92910.1 pyoverdin chromophore biosynthetic protein pvcC [Cupriavidus sp. TA19]